MSGYSLDGEPVQGSTLQDDGQLHDTMVVYWRMNDGSITGSVRVPLEGDWASAAADQINQQLAKLSALGIG